MQSLQDNVPTDYIAYYPLDTDSHDETGNYDGTDYGGVTYDGESASFDGVNDYVALPTFTLNTEYTVSIWCTRLGNAEILLGSNSTTNLEYMIYINSTTMYIGRTASGGSFAYGAVTVPIIWSVFKHIVITRKGSGNILKCYIDGIEQSITYTNTLFDSCVLDRIGQWYGSNSSSYAWTGKASNLRIYNRALDQEEITQLYNEGY